MILRSIEGTSIPAHFPHYYITSTYSFRNQGWFALDDTPVGHEWRFLMRTVPPYHLRRGQRFNQKRMRKAIDTRKGCRCSAYTWRMPELGGE